MTLDMGTQTRIMHWKNNNYKHIAKYIVANNILGEPKIEINQQFFTLPK